jgi:hypothetical protein
LQAIQNYQLQLVLVFVVFLLEAAVGSVCPAVRVIKLFKAEMLIVFLRNRALVPELLFTEAAYAAHLLTALALANVLKCCH